MRKIAFSLVMIILLSTIIGFGETYEGDIILPVGLGDGKVAYSNNIIDSEILGPESFAIRNNGDIYILDSVDRQIEIFSNKGDYLKTINLEKDDAYFDITVLNNGNVAVASYRGRIYQYKKDANTISIAHEIKSFSEADYIMFELYNGDGDEIILRNLNDYSELNITNQTKNLSLMNFKVTSSNTKAQGKKNISFRNQSERSTEEIHYNTDITAAVYPISKSNESLILKEINFRVNNTIIAENCVIKIDKEGKTEYALLDSTANDYTRPNKYYTLDKNDDVFQMHCNKENLIISQSRFSTKKESQLKAVDESSLKFLDQDEVSKKEVDEIVASLNNTTRSVSNFVAYTNALNYRDHEWIYYPSIMRTPNTATKSAPNHLNHNNDTYQAGLPYCWGGNDSIQTFDSILGDKTAGDTNTSAAVISDVTGVDCSGFIQRVYEISGNKISTSMMSSYFYVKPWNDLILGDIMNKSGDHVVMHISSEKDANGNIVGVSTIESTTAGYAQKVKSYSRSVSNLSGYVGMRRNGY